MKKMSKGSLPSPPKNAIPLAPFFNTIFGDSLNSEEGVLAAITYINSNKQEFADLLRQYVENGEDFKLRQRSGELEKIL